jgi:hypothetical protein
MTFKPFVAINEEGEVQGTKGVNLLAVGDIFEQFVTQSQLFQSFLITPWRDCLFKLFVFHRQLLSLGLICAVLHVHPTITGKAASLSVDLLKDIAQIFNNETYFYVAGHTFDGDNGLNGLHEEFSKD